MTETESPTPAPTPRRGCWRWGCGVIFLLAILGGWWLQRPSYLVLPIPVKPGSHGRPHAESIWDEAHYSVLYRGDSFANSYIHRQVGMAWAKPEGWKTTAEAMGFFDQWLRRHGWEYSAQSWEPMLPESRFLREGTEYRFYKRAGEAPWTSGPLVAVAIEPLTKHGKFVEPTPFAFNVTLVTSKPSWLRLWSDSWD